MSCLQVFLCFDSINSSSDRNSTVSQDVYDQEIISEDITDVLRSSTCEAWLS